MVRLYGREITVNGWKLEIKPPRIELTPIKLDRL